MNDGLDNLRKEIVQIAYDTGEGHIASSFSVLNILNVLYKDILNIKKDNVYDDGRNIFIMSKGHASIGLYAVLEKYGILTEDQLKSFGSYGSILGGHPDKNKVPGVEASTGSLGHGFPIAVGMALGKKIQKLEGRVYTLVGDGELNEGSNWEAVLLAAQHRLSNFCCIVDYNHSTDRALSLENLKSKFEAFNWEVTEVDGHNEALMKEQLMAFHKIPKVIIANTIKGYGCKRMENNPEWHHKSPNEVELNEIMEELQ